MKKIFISAIIMLLVLSITSCSVNTLEGACDEADEIVQNWNSQKEAGCTYSSKFYTDDNLYIVSAKIGYENYAGEDSRVWGALTEIIAQEIEEDLYPELEKIFADFDVDIALGVYDYNNDMYCYIHNGVTKYK